MENDNYPGLPLGCTYDDYDQSRLGGQEQEPAVTHDPYLRFSVTHPVAVHVFGNKVVIVANDGEVSEVER